MSVPVEHKINGMQSSAPQGDVDSAVPHGCEFCDGVIDGCGGPDLLVGPQPVTARVKTIIPATANLYIKVTVAFRQACFYIARVADTLSSLCTHCLLSNVVKKSSTVLACCPGRRPGLGCANSRSSVSGIPISFPIAYSTIDDQLTLIPVSRILRAAS